MLAGTLERAGYQVVPLEDGFELSDYLELINPRSGRAHQPDLVLTDLKMPGKSGLDAVRQARSAGLTCPVVLLSGFADDNVAEQTQGLGETLLLSKPIEVEMLLAVIHRLLQPPPSAALGTRVLVVEDNAELRQLLRVALHQRGCIVEEAGDGLQMTARLLADRKDEPPPDLVITDVRIPWSGGLDVLSRLEFIGWKPRFIVMTAFGDAETHARARSLGAEEVFDKPFEIDELADAAVRAARKTKRS